MRWIAKGLIIVKLHSTACMSEAQHQTGNHILPLQYPPKFSNDEAGGKFYVFDR